MPYVPLPDTLIANGWDIQAFDGFIVTDLSQLIAPGTRRGSNDPIPGAHGELGAELPYAAFAFSISVRVFGDTRAEMIANLAFASTVLAGTNGLIPLARRLATDNVGGYDEHTANGQFASRNSFTLLNANTGDTELQFVNLTGGWLSGTTLLDY